MRPPDGISALLIRDTENVITVSLSTVRRYSEKAASGQEEKPDQIPTRLEP